MISSRDNPTKDPNPLLVISADCFFWLSALWICLLTFFWQCWVFLPVVCPFLPVCGKWLSKKRLTCLLKAKAGIYTDTPTTPANKLVYDLEPLLIWCRAAAKASPSQVGKWLREGS